MKEFTLDKLFKTLPDKHIKKGEFLLREGDLTNTFFYVQSGCLRSYIIDGKGKEHIYQFAPEDWVISDEEVFLTQKPAILYIDAIEDSVVKVLVRPNGNGFSNLDKETANEIIQKLELKINSLRRRIIQLLSATAEERYSYFITTYPSLARRVPLKMLASYLGITPESLSRVRKELMQKK